MCHSSLLPSHVPFYPMGPRTCSYPLRPTICVLTPCAPPPMCSCGLRVCPYLMCLPRVPLSHVPPLHPYHMCPQPVCLDSVPHAPLSPSEPTPPHVTPLCPSPRPRVTFHVSPTPCVPPPDITSGNISLKYWKLAEISTASSEIVFTSAIPYMYMCVYTFINIHMYMCVCVSLCTKEYPCKWCNPCKRYNLSGDEDHGNVTLNYRSYVISSSVPNSCKRFLALSL
jgi:hypothetical protein